MTDDLVEHLADDWGLFVRAGAPIEKFHSALQAVDVYETASFGKLFRLDGHLMTSEKDEFFYHENLVHIAAIAHPSPVRALIVGGGDGGSAEELLKYASVDRVTIAEIDAAVVDVARRHFEGVHHGALDDPRVTVRIGDGFAFVRTASTRYDLIVLDLTDPGGPSTALYTPAFYRACAERLGAFGAMTMHVGSPVAHAGRVRTTLAQLRDVFAIVTPYLTSIPLYGGSWMMACCSAALDPTTLSEAAVDQRIAARGLRDLQYINGATYRAGCAMPNYIRAYAPQRT